MGKNKFSFHDSSLQSVNNVHIFEIDIDISQCKQYPGQYIHSPSVTINLY